MIIILGTCAPGGVNAVIQSYINLDVYRNSGYALIPTHSGRGKFTDIIFFLKSLFLFIKYMMIENPSAVHAHMTYNGSFWRKYVFFKISKFFGVPFICHLHGSEFKVYVENSSPLRLGLIKEIVLSSDRFLVLSQGWKNYIDKTFGGDCSVLPNFIDIPKLDVSLKQPKNILFVGALIHRKGILDLIQACSRLNCGFVLNVCGDGPLRADAESLTQELGIQSAVIFHGWVDGTEKFRLYEKCTTFVLPSYNEGLPLVILEAMASRCVVLATDVGAIAEVVENDRTGFIISPGDIDAIAARLSYILNNETTLETISDRAHEFYVQNCSSLAVIPILKGLYKSLAVDI